MAAARKPRYNGAKSTVAKLMCDHPLPLRVRHQKDMAKERTEMVLTFELLGRIEEALRDAWAKGYAARMDQEARR